MWCDYGDGYTNEVKTTSKMKKYPRHTSKTVTEMTVSHFCTWGKHAWQDRKGFRQSRKQQSSQAGRNMSHGNMWRWRRAVAMATRPETHAGIPQQCLGWMKRREAAPGCHEKGGEEKTIKYMSQQSQAETHTAAPCWPGGLLEHRKPKQLGTEDISKEQTLCKYSAYTRVFALSMFLGFGSGIWAWHFQCKFICFSEYQPEFFYLVDNHFWSQWKPISAM